MRQITLIILSFFISTIAAAKCAGSGIYCLSQTTVLNSNGLIILEFYGSSQSLISGLNNKYPIYLKSSAGKVPLIIIETLKGEMSLTQIVLKPATLLTVNEYFTLQIDNLPKDEAKPVRYNNLPGRRNSLTFKITHSIDNDIPVFTNPPAEQKKTMVQYGCGPASWVYFSMEGQDSSELFVRATVTNKATGKSSSYILAIENAVAKVGHGMCSGAFHFDDGENFEVSFQLFDQSGNKSSLSNEIAFTKPARDTKEE